MTSWAAFETERDPSVRIAICEALASTTERSTQRLADAAKRDGAWGVRRAAVEALVKLAPESAASVVVGVVRRERRLPTLREAARSALVRLGALAVPALSELVADRSSDPAARVIAATLLGPLGAVAPLKALAKEKDRDVRSACLALSPWSGARRGRQDGHTRSSSRRLRRPRRARRRRGDRHAA